MGKKRRLAEAEWEVMDAVWELDRTVTVREVHGHLYPNGEKAYTTVQTIMNILTDKGVLDRKKIGPVNVYASVFSRQAAAGDETGSLVTRMFEGSFGALASYLVDSGSLSRKELDALRELIDEKEREQKGGA
jgi:BlaI family transcriptional regulator, penicillinase repressor